MARAYLTNNRLEAIVEALTQRLAGPIEGELPRSYYGDALEWAQLVQARRAAGGRGNRVLDRDKTTGQFRVSEALRCDDEAAP